MIFFTNIISILKVIICWPTAVVLIVFILRRDISKIVDRIDFQGISRNIFKDKKEK